jgi:predicted PurR-regulated permease PerM
VVGQGLGIVVLAASLYILWQIRRILLLLFTAVVLATAANGLVRRVQTFNVSRGKAILISLGLFLLLAIIFIGLVVPPFVAQFQELFFERVPEAIDQLWRSIPKWIDQVRDRLPEKYEEARATLEMLREWVQGNQELQINPRNWSSFLATLPGQAGPLVANFFKNFFGFFNNALAVTVQLLLVLILTFMFLGNPSEYRNAFLTLFPSFYRRRADRILTLCEVDLTNWFGGIMLSSLFVAILTGLGLRLLGVDLALAHALLAGLLNFIPNIGPTLSIVFPLSVAIQDPSWWVIGGIFLLYGLVQQIESYWLTPTLMAHQVSLLPALTLIAQIFFASTFGLLGLILALPLTVVSKVWIQELLIRDVLDQWHEPSPSKR